MNHREIYRGWIIEVWPQSGGRQYPPKYAITKKKTEQGWTFFNREGCTVAACIEDAREQIDYIDPPQKTCG